MICSGSSARPMRSRSRMKASIRAFSARQKSSSSPASGWSALIASSTRRTSCVSSDGIGSSRTQSGQSWRARRTISPRTCSKAAVRAARGRSGVTVGLQGVPELLRVQLRPEPEVARRARQPGRHAASRGTPRPRAPPPRQPPRGRSGGRHRRAAAPRRPRCGPGPPRHRWWRSPSRCGRRSPGAVRRPRASPSRPPGRRAGRAAAMRRWRGGPAAGRTRATGG